MTCAILLATKNGETFLAQQLESIKRQSYTNWVIYASDDGSTDATLDILLLHQKQWGKKKLTIFQGPQQGYAQNFWSLVHRVKSKNINYFAFCDQDDLWTEDHLKRAIHIISFFKQPCLYGSRTQYIDQDGRLSNLSPQFLRYPCFQNALVQNIAGGNTQIFNKYLLYFLQKIPLGTPIVSHDWMAYQVTTCLFGKVFYSQEPTVLYRQHTLNIIGRNDLFYNKLKRFINLLQGQFRYWTNDNLKCLQFVYDDMTPYNQLLFLNFIKYRESNSVFRLVHVFRLNLFRQTFFGQLALYLALILKKI